MNSKKILSLVLCLFFVISIGCKKEPTYSRFEDHSISACGIADPLLNIPWLKTYSIEHLNSYSVSISIYKNIVSDENHIFIVTSTPFVPDMSPSPIYTESVYTCDGIMILFQGSEGPIPAGWNAFFVENTLVAKIWEVKQIVEP
jgi:hypothetical protein